jgi:hypothetical protein
VGPWIDTNAHWLHESAPGLAALAVVAFGKGAANDKVQAAWKALLGRPLPTYPEPAPVGYRWVSQRWKPGPRGRRHYALYDGKEAYHKLLPVSRIRSPRRKG